MPKRKQKRVNPNRVPISKEELDENRILAEASDGNMYYAWLLILPTLTEQESMTHKRVIEIWDTVNEYASQPRPADLRASEETRRAENLMGLRMPHSHIDLDHIRTKGDLLAAKRKLKEDALHSALCIICLGLEKTKLFSQEELRRLFFNANLTMAEIESGITSYACIAQQLQAQHIILQDSNEDMHIADEDDSEDESRESAAFCVEISNEVN